MTRPPDVALNDILLRVIEMSTYADATTGRVRWKPEPFWHNLHKAGYTISPTAPSQDVAERVERAAAALIEGLHPGGSFILSATDGAAKYDADRFRDIAAAVLATARASEPTDGWRPITDADRQIGPSFFGGKWHYTANGWEWHEHNAFWSAGMQSFCDTWSGKKIDLDWRRPLPSPAPMPEAAPAPAPEREG